MLKRVIIGLIVGFGAVMPSFAWGADSNSITASPTTKSVEVAAGTTSAGTVKVVNTGASNYDFSVYVDPFSVKGEDYAQSYVLQPNMVDASKWFKLRQTHFSLKAGQELAVPYELAVPAGVGPGGYYAVLFAETSEVNVGNVRSKKRVGIIFYLTVSGAVKRSGSVESFTVPGLHIEPPLAAVLRMKNEGNVHYDADVHVEVKDIFGNTKVALEANKVVLPQTVRKMQLKWDKAPDFGLFRVEGTVKHDGKTEQLPTRYTLMLSATAFVVMFLVMLGLIIYAFTTRGRRSNVSRRR